MLPHRGQFVPQFTPHGFQLIPESLLSPLGSQQLVEHALAVGEMAAEAAAAATTTTTSSSSVTQQQQQQQHSPLYADSVKRKRKLKMKKHKYKKRMRALKASLK